MNRVETPAEKADLHRREFGDAVSRRKSNGSAAATDQQFIHGCATNLLSCFIGQLPLDTRRALVRLPGEVIAMNLPRSTPIGWSAATAVGSSRAVRLLTVSIARELGILLSLSVMFPFMIHIIPVPENAQLGSRLLPMFYAPLLATLWGRTPSALIVALLAPWLNWALTSHPSPPSAIVMSVQLLVFVLALRSLRTRVRPDWILAAPAYFAGLAAAVLLCAVFPGLIRGQPALAWAARGVVTGLPGLVLLIIINWLALRAYPPGAAGGGPAAA
jgi:hypothetical protein